MRVLLAEDDARISRFIKKGLEAERYEVHLAPDGQQALELGGTGLFDIILLDIVLPKIDGIQVCRQLRTQGVHTPIVMVTARDAVEHRINGLEAGADDYLTKPFAFEELLARIRAVLRRPPELDASPVLEAADLRLDRNTYEVRRAGGLVSLTPREFALLEFLMRRAGRVVSRTVIEEQVWGYQHDPLTNVVDVYIRRLRRKIDRHHQASFISTVRGAGYVLKP